MTTIAGALAGRRDEPLAALAGAVAQAQQSLPGVLESARGGSADAFAALIRTFQGPTYQFILRMVRRPATAEDLAQEVFIRL